MPIDRTSHSLVVNEEKHFEVIENVADQSAVLQVANVRPMRTGRETVVVSGGITWPAGMSGVAELGTKPSMTGTLNGIDLVANKMAVFLVVSDELLADTDEDIVGFYQGEIEKQMAKLIDLHAIHGGDWAGAEGIVDAVTTLGGDNVVVKGSGVDLAADMNSMLAAVENDDHTPSGFMAARRIKSQLRGLRDANRQPIYVESLTQEQQDLLYGEPVYYIGGGVFGNAASQVGPPAVPGDTQAVAGDFSQYVVGIRQELQFTLHNEGTVGGVNLLEQNATALRAEMRLAGKVIRPAAFSILNNA